MYQANDEATYQQSKCPVCGGQDFEWGRLGGQAYYLPSMSAWAMKGRQVIKVRRCLRCSALIPFTDPALTRQFNRLVAVIAVVAIGFAVLIAALSMFMAASSVPK